MLEKTPIGLYCPAGGFYIDPMGSVENAVITHAHSDHARRGSRRYYSTHATVPLLRTRLSGKIDVQGFTYGETVMFGQVKVSFHPAGHILGSAQVRMEFQGEVWVASGDYKREPDPTCEPFEVVKCDTFVTEATFGTPSYHWPRDINLGLEIFEWWQENSSRGINSLLFAYSLGKAQRVLGVLEPFTKNYSDLKVYCHKSISDLNACYRDMSVKLSPTICFSTLEETTQLHGALVLAPPSFLKSPQAKMISEDYRTAFASGWMALGSSRGFSSYDRGFVMSDHADWNDLVRTVTETGAQRVFVQHRGKGALVRHLRSLGIKAFAEEDLIPSPNRGSQLSFEL